MSILYLGDYKSPHFTKWVTPLNAQGMRIHFPAYDIHDGLRIFIFIKCIIYLVRCIYIIKKNNIKLIHLHFVGWYALPTIVICKLYSLPLVVTVWGSDVNFPKKGIIKKIKKIVFLLASKIICDAQHIRQKINSICNVDEKIQMIEFGIDYNFFSSVKNCKFNMEDITIYTNRNHEDIYNYKFTLEFFKLVQSKYKNARLIVAGSGSKTSDYKKYIEKYSIKNVDFKGAFTALDLLEHLSESNVYISSSMYDGGIATSVVEAMAAGKVCLLPDVLDNARHAKHKNNAILFNPEDPKKLLLDLEECLNTNSYETITSNARDHVKKHLALQTSTKLLGELYEKVLKNSSY